MPADTHDRTTAGLNRLVAILLGVVVVLAIIGGLRSLWLAQSGELRPAPTRAAGVLAQPEAERRSITVNECSDAKGRRVYSTEACADAKGAATRELEVTTVELAPARQ